MNKQSGQTLIEVVAAISIASVVLGGLVIVVLNGLRNAKFAQNQALATKYSQDTMEELRAIRDRNSMVDSSSPTTFSCYLGGCNPSPSCASDPNGCLFSLNDSNLNLKEITDTTPPDSLGNGFTRSISMGPFGLEKTFIVTVSWIDISGTHQSVLETRLTHI